MKSKLTTAVISCVFVALMGATVHADETAPPLVAQINSGNWLDEEEAQELRDELFYQRAAFFQFAYSSALAMVTRTIGAGSKYPIASKDADGNFLNGANHYKMHLPTGIPAKDFWAVTLYNITDGTMPETPQLLPSKNSLDESIAKNEDGSVDLYFGPTQPKDVDESNWIQTVDGRDFMAVIRLYGADIEFFDQTWKPNDVVKIQ